MKLKPNKTEQSILNYLTEQMLKRKNISMNEVENISITINKKNENQVKKNRKVFTK